jgi:parallel beta-helix repeat protein
MLLALLVGTLNLALRVEKVKASGTIYVRANGTVEPEGTPISTFDNVTYTFAGNINDSIVVERDNIVVDGVGYTLQGPGSGNGIDLSSRSNATIRNTNIKGFSYGILLSGSSNISITENNVTDNSWDGIGLWNSGYNSISGNNIANNGGIGIELTGLSGSSNNSIVGNILVNDGLRVWDSFGNVVVDNLVNDKPLVYLEGASDVVVEDAGQVILVNCNRIRVANLNLSNTNTGVQLWQTNSATISGNHITNNGYGIELESSSNHNNIIGNYITNNNEYGIRLIMGYSSKYNSIVGNYIINNRYGIESGAENSISGNTVTNNTYDGIRLDYSSNSSISGNNITNNSYGILLYSSSNNSISGNNITANELYGIELSSSANDNSISGNNVTNNGNGLYLDESSNNTLSENNVTNSDQGIWLYYSSDNIVSGNNIAVSNYYGILLHLSSNNTFSGNSVTNSGYAAIWLSESSDNKIYHNDFLENTLQVSVYMPGYVNLWDDGYPSGGNYWSDYNGTDANHDGIGDTSYVIDAKNTDHYPLTGMFYGFNVSWIDSGYNVRLISNSSVSAFDVSFWIEHPENPNTRIIEFNVEGEAGTTGFCRICIPIALLNASYTVLLNGTEIPYTLLPCSDANYSYLYFTYTHSSEEVIITPEFPTFFIMSLFMMATLLTLFIRGRKKRISSADL